MRRRTFLGASGMAVTGIAGCLGGDNGETAANEYGYETTTSDGTEVPLVPIEDAIEWYDDDETVFVDTRDRTAFDRARIAGSVFSPAPDGQETDDPMGEYDEERRIVTYCVCPHYLAGLRGASLIRAGYAHTYALDEGFEPWVEGGHPVEGDAVDSRPPVYEIRGSTAPEHADEYAWARHEPTGQREAVPIRADGSFTLHLRFHDIDRASTIEVQTPGGSTTAPLGALTEDTLDLR